MGFFKLLLPVFLIAFLSPLFTRADAQETGAGEAVVRVGRHEDHWRIVFTSTEENVQKASVQSTGKTSFLVDFPAAISFTLLEKSGARRPVSGSGLEVAKGLSLARKDGGCSLTVEGLEGVTVSRLPSPWRLIVDASITGTEAPVGAEVPVSAVASPAQRVSLFSGPIVIDPGHGGYESGVQYKGQKEKDIALSVATELAVAVSKEGRKAFLTRKSDRNLSLRDRIVFVKKRSPSLLISVHVSSRPGFAIYSPIADGKERVPLGRAEQVQILGLTKRIFQVLSEEFGLDVRAEKLPLPIVEGAGVPAVLVELPSPAGFSYDAKSVKKIAQTISRAIGSGEGTGDQ